MKLKKQLLIIFFVCIYWQDIHAQTLTDLPDHPRVILNNQQLEQVKAGIEKDERISALHQRVVDVSDNIIPLKPMKRKQVGRRLLGVSRTVLKRVVHLSYSYRMTGKRKYLERAEEEMLAAAAFSDWNPSHFLDVAEMTAALAIGYDWLYDDLSKKTKEKIREAIIQKGLIPSKKHDDWAHRHNNWNQVCNGGIVLGALAIFEQEQDHARQMIDRARESIKIPLKVYEPDGAYPEGPGYWSYGTTYHVILIDAVHSALNNEKGFQAPDAFLNSAVYKLHVYGPEGFFNYADNHRRNSINPVLFWFADKLNDNTVLWPQKEPVKEAIENDFSPKKIAKGQTGRFNPFLIIWSSRLKELTFEKPEKLSWTGDGNAPVGVHRTSWNDDAIFAGIKAGTPSSNHGHMDIGSFVMDAGGVRWAIDLGGHGYHKLEKQGLYIWDKEQNADRWRIKRYTNHFHNTLTVNGQLQQVKGFAPIIKHTETSTKIDMTNVYQGQLAKVERTLSIVDRKYLKINDIIENTNRKSTVRWSMVTHDNIKINKNNTATIKEDGKRLTFKVISSKNITIRTWTTNPQNDFEDKNPGTERLGFEIQMSPGEKTELEVHLIPENY